MKNLIGRIWPFTTKIKTNLSRICPKDRKTMQLSQRKILRMKTMHKILQIKVMILSCPKYPKKIIEFQICALEEGNRTSDLIPTQTTQKTLRTLTTTYALRSILTFSSFLDIWGKLSEIIALLVSAVISLFTFELASKEI